MPDLGKYADTVLTAYAASILLLVALVAVTLLRSHKVKNALKAAEKRADL